MSIQSLQVRATEPLLSTNFNDPTPFIITLLKIVQQQLIDGKRRLLVVPSLEAQVKHLGDSSHHQEFMYILPAER